MPRKTVFILHNVLLAFAATLRAAEAQASPNASSPTQQSWSLSLELGVIIAVLAAAAVVGFTLYKRAELHSIQKQTAILRAKTEEIRARQRQSMQTKPKNVCKYCTAPVAREAAFCPVCQRALR